MSLNSLGMLVSLVVMIVSVCCMPKITGTARRLAFVVMLLATAAFLFLLAGSLPRSSEERSAQCL